MRYLKSFNESKEMIPDDIIIWCREYKVDPVHFICTRYNIQNYTTNSDGSIDVAGSVYLSYKGISKLPLRFNKVSGNFNCSSNRLTSLEGSPKEVGGYFYCEENEITSLEGGPKKVGGSFDCRNNNLTSVRGLPEDFEGNLHLDDNPVYEIFDLFREINSDVHGIRSYRIAHLLNEYDVISQDGKKIYRDSLEEVFHLLGLNIPKDIKIHGYEIH